MASRLKIPMPKIIPQSQFAFLKGRFIHNNIILAQEVLSIRKSKANNAMMAIKIDLTKAFD